MTDREIDELIAEVDRMAQRLGCNFIPDPDRLMAFRCAQRAEQEMREHYRKERQRVNDGQPSNGR